MNNNEEKLWKLMKVYPRRTFWMAALIGIIFGLICVILMPVGLIWFQEDSERFVQIGLTIFLSMMGIVYITNWIICFQFIKKANELEYKELEEAFLKRLIKLYIFFCVVYMIPLTFIISIKGFGVVNRLAHKQIAIGAPHEKLYLHLMRK